MYNTPKMAGESRKMFLERLRKVGFESSRAEKAMEWEFRDWSIEEVDMLLDRLRPLGSVTGSRAPCGPRFNRLGTVSENLKLTFEIYFWRFLFTSCFLPLQFGLAFYLCYKRRWRAILTELHRPTLAVWRFATTINSFVKAPSSLIRKSADECRALCVSSQGEFRLISQGYTVMSHAWMETMSWAWGSVTLDLRKKDMSLDHSGPGSCGSSF